MACAVGPTLCMYRGDTDNIPLTVTNPDGSPLDLTGYTITFGAKKVITQPTLDIDITITITDASGGLANIPFSSTDTDVDIAVYTYDVQFKNGAGTIVKTFQGTLSIEQDVRTS